MALGGKEDMAQYTYIIVELQDGQEKGTRVKKNFVGPFNAPTNYGDATIASTPFCTHFSNR
jgi:hypothetical protein